MTVTSERVLWIRPRTSARYVALAWTIGLFLQLGMRPPMRKPITIELADVTRIWRWQPQFARPAWLEVGKGGGMSFWLMNPGRHWMRRADPQALDEHLKVIEAAGEAVRSRATTHDAQP